MTLEQTAIHEAGHAIVWLTEESELGPLTLVTTLPGDGSLGRVLGTEKASRLTTPRQRRALARALAAGGIAERLDGYPTAGPEACDAEKLARVALLGENFSNTSPGASLVRTQRARRFIEAAEAGAELALRAQWGGVLRLRETLLSLGILTPPHGIELVRLAFEERPLRPLAPDLETLTRLLRAVERVPEITEPFRRELRGIARAA